MPYRDSVMRIRAGLCLCWGCMRRTLLPKKNLLGKTLTCKHRTLCARSEDLLFLYLYYTLTFFPKYTLSKMEFSLIKESGYVLDIYIYICHMYIDMSLEEWNVRTEIPTIDRIQDLYFFISPMTKYSRVERTFVWTDKYLFLFIIFYFTAALVYTLIYCIWILNSFFAGKSNITSFKIMKKNFLI